MHESYISNPKSEVANWTRLTASSIRYFGISDWRCRIPISEYLHSIDESSMLMPPSGRGLECSKTQPYVQSPQCRCRPQPHNSNTHSRFNWIGRWSSACCHNCARPALPVGNTHFHSREIEMAGKKMAALGMWRTHADVQHAPFSTPCYLMWQFLLDHAQFPSPSPCDSSGSSRRRIQL